MADILGKERNQIVITLKCDEAKNHNFTRCIRRRNKSNSRTNYGSL